MVRPERASVLILVWLCWLWWGWERPIMLHNATVSDPLRPTSRSRLSWRSPSVKNEPGCEVRRYPATTVLLPAQLHSDSCNSIFSSWDIEREEGRAASERRAPLAHFRRSYILSDCKDQDYQPPQPPVTLSLRQAESSEINSSLGILFQSVLTFFMLNYFWGPPPPQPIPTSLSKHQFSLCCKLAGFQSNFTKHHFLQWKFKNKNKENQQNILRQSTTTFQYKTEFNPTKRIFQSKA